MKKADVDFIPLSEAALRLGISRMTAWRWVKAGILPATNLGRRFYVHPADVKWLQDLSNKKTIV